MSKRSFRQHLDQVLERGDQVRVAEAVGISPQTISDWKHGRRAPSPRHVHALEAALDLEPGELSRHLGYVTLAAEQSGRYETELLIDATQQEVRHALAELGDVPMEELVDDVDAFVRDAAERGLKPALGYLAVELYEREHGAFTPEELDEAAARLDAASGPRVGAT